MKRYAGAVRDGSDLAVKERGLIVLSRSRVDALNSVRVGVRVPLFAHLLAALITGDESGRDVELVGGARKRVLQCSTGGNKDLQLFESFCLGFHRECSGNLSSTVHEPANAAMPVYEAEHPKRTLIVGDEVLHRLVNLSIANLQVFILPGQHVRCFAV